MEKHIPFEKLSKKKQKELNAKRRTTWGDLNPVTRRPENPKAYNRKKAQKWRDDSSMTVPFSIAFFPGLIFYSACFRYSRISAALVSGFTLGITFSIIPCSSMI